MSRREGGDSLKLGTRFLLYPQVPHVSGYDKPEPVWISTPPDRIRAGPEDDRMFVRDPLFEKEPYEFPFLPPFVGDTFPPAEAAPDGHFDHLNPDSRQFVAAHAFASARRVLDIWESHLGTPVVWHFVETYERLEIIPFLNWDNAQSGYGYLELGVDRSPDGPTYPYALNFDVIAHEIGHAILFSLSGVPAGGLSAGDFGPFHEASSDVIAILSFLHFGSALDRLLRRCDGNLLVLNELNRIAELAGDRQIRLASNARRMTEVSGEIHDRSRPFTGAIFDTLVESYHGRLVSQGLAEEGLVDVDLRNVGETALGRISELTASAYRARPFLFTSPLAAARDDVARALAQAWPQLDANDITFGKAARAVVDAAAAFEPALAERFDVNFRWREIN